MTGEQTLLARLTLGSVAAVASLLLTRWQWLLSQPRGKFDRAVFGLFAVTRIGLFTLIFLVLRIPPRGDVPAYYWEQAGEVLRGLMPYRDFVSSYAPLHPYFDAGLISLWHTPLAIMLASVLVELAILPVWLRAGRAFLTEEELRVAALLYLASPLSLQFVAIDGQDNVIIATLIAFAVLLAVRSRIFAAGTAFGMSIAAIKFLPLLYAPAFFLATPRRWRMAAGALAVCGVVYGGFLAIGSPIMAPLAAEGDLWSAGDIPFLLEVIFGAKIPYRLSDTVLLLALITIFVLIGRSARRADVATRLRAITFGTAALTLTLLVLSKKSWPPYMMLALFPVCLVAAGGMTAHSRIWNRGRAIAFAAFGIVCVTEHSYWATSLAQFGSIEFHQALLAGKGSAFFLLLLELALIVGYLWLLLEAVSRILPRPMPGSLEVSK